MKLWVFDNDGTIYNDSGAGSSFMELFYAYFARISGKSIESSKEEIGRLKSKWNTEFSILALVKEYKIDFSEIVKETYLRIDPTVFKDGMDISTIQSINNLPGEKIVFTNNPSAYARFVLENLGLSDSFLDVIGMEEMDLKGKPDPFSYEVVEKRFSSRPIIFCDDSLKNLDAAAQRGWITVWKKPVSVKCPSQLKHLVVESLEELYRFV